MWRHTVMIFLLIWTPVQLQKPNVESITNQPTDTIEDSSPTAKVVMPCPFTCRKMFCADPNFLSQPKNFDCV